MRAITCRIDPLFCFSYGKCLFFNSGSLEDRFPNIGAFLCISREREREGRLLTVPVAVAGSSQSAPNIGHGGGAHSPAFYQKRRRPGFSVHSSLTMLMLFVLGRHIFHFHSCLMNVLPGQLTVHRS